MIIIFTMKARLTYFFIGIFFFMKILSVHGQEVKVIFDTDVGGDVDDAGALAVLHALADREEIELLAMGVVIGHEAAVPYVHAVNTWYGRPDLPIGTIKKKAPYARDEYMVPVSRNIPLA